MSDDTTTGDMMTDEARALDVRDLKPHGWRHGATWTYLIVLLASAAALIVSFVLSAETLQLARHPKEQLGCDVNAVLSCSAVAQSMSVRAGGVTRMPDACHSNPVWDIYRRRSRLSSRLLGPLREAMWIAPSCRSYECSSPYRHTALKPANTHPGRRIASARIVCSDRSSTVSLFQYSERA